MRFTRFSGIAATVALGAATVLGGAGVAQAQSSGSLGSLTAGSSAPAPLELTLDEADKDGAQGTFTNKTTQTVENCIVAVSDAEVVRDIEAAHKKGTEINPLPANLDKKLQDANALHQNWLAVGVGADAGKTAPWTGAQGAVKADKDYQAGAFVRCVVDGKDTFAFAYEPGGTGSLSNVFGSLGSSNDDASANDAPATDDKKVGSLSNIFGSSDKAETPA